MSRAAQTDLAVLGALSIEPMSGYAVRAAIRDTLGHFWHESFGQIYPTLTRLEAEGAVTRVETGARKAFAITDRGRTRLRELLREPFDSPPPRNALLLRLFFGAELGQEECLALLRDARTRVEEAAAAYAGLAEEPPTSDAGETYRRLTLSYGRRMARAQLDWLDEAEAIVAALCP